jgi:hypothetical protein
MEKKASDPATNLIKSKRLLITRLTREIDSVRKDAEVQTERLRNRIFVAKTLLSALEKGTIKAAHLNRK